MSYENSIENPEARKSKKHGIKRLLRIVEGFIVLCIIMFVLFIISFPGLPICGRNPNESRPFAVLQNVISAQAYIKAQAAIDLDKDGCGEYGYLGEMAGTVPLRSMKGQPSVTLTPGVLSHALGIVDRHGLMQKSGYYFRMFIADDRCMPAGEAEGGGDGGAARAWKTQDPAETYWVCYAWPVEWGGDQGTRAFMTNQTGDVLQTNNMEQRYCGTENMPDPLAAYIRGGKGDMTDPLAIQGQPSPARDGGVWTVIN